MDEKDPVEQAPGGHDAVDATPEASPQTEADTTPAEEPETQAEAGQTETEAASGDVEADSEGTPPVTVTESPESKDLPDSEAEEISEQLDESAVDAFSADQLSLEDKASDEDAERARLRATVEAAVYITEDPLTAKQIAEALEEPADKVSEALADLVAEYEQAHHGLIIREVAEGFKMGTKAEFHDSLRSFVKKLQKPLKLSMASLETLAVVAYKQPITAPEIMEIRGVQGAGVLKTLLDRKLITTAGRKNVIGKPILYRTTKEFLVQFGLKNLKELPTLKEFEELARVALADAEEPDDVPEQMELTPAAEPSSSKQHEQQPAPADEAEQAGDSIATDADAELEPDEQTGPDADSRSESTPESESEGDAEPLGPQSERRSDSEAPAGDKRHAAPEE